MYMPALCESEHPYIGPANLRTTKFRLFGNRHQTILRSSKASKCIMQTRCISRYT